MKIIKKKFYFLIIFLIFLGIFFLTLANDSTKKLLADEYEYYHDLTVEEITITPLSPAVSQVATVLVKVKNNGRIHIESSLGLDNYSYQFENFAQDGVSYSSPTPDDPFFAQTYLYFTFTGWFSSEGNKTLSFTIDSSNALDEKYENNNSYSVIINVLPLEENPDIYYDLAVSSMTIAPSNPAVDQDCLITVNVKNEGTRNIYSTTGLSTSYQFPNFTLASSSFSYPTINKPSAPGEYLTYLYGGKFKEKGIKSLVFTIDKSNDLEESKEDNNSITKDITIISAGEADLSISKIEPSNKNPILFEKINIVVTVVNNDNYSLVNKKGLEIYQDAVFNFSGFVLDSISYDNYPTVDNPFSKNEEYNYTFLGHFNKIGDNNLIFSIDDKNVIIEKNESNNSTSTITTVYYDAAARDDFTILSHSLDYISSSSVRIKWLTDKDTTSKARYRENGYETAETDVNSADNKKNHFATISNLDTNKKYLYKLIANNATVEKSTIYTNLEMPVDDKVSITTNVGSKVDNNNKSFSLNWSTNLFSTGHVYYKKNSEAGYSSAGSDTLSIDHEVKLENLELSIYNYYFVSTSTPGTVYKSDIMMFEIIGANVPQGPNGDDGDTGPSKDLPLEGENLNGDNENGRTITVTNQNLYNSLKGKIILKVEENGEAYYINPKSQEMYFLGRPKDAFSIMRRQGIGITSSNLTKIPIGLSNLTGLDSDSDGLPDLLEDAIGTDKDTSDTDGDGNNDKLELENGYSPSGSGKIIIDNNFIKGQIGKIFLQVERNGEAWYINPADSKRYFLGRPADAFSVMRNLGLGISNNNFDSL
ncbi:MAG: CARDB domain-containing protein [Patescibacteria group bacterium]